MIDFNEYKGKYVVLYNGEVIDSDDNLEDIIKRVPISGMLLYIPDNKMVMAISISNEKIFLCEAYDESKGIQISEYFDNEEDAREYAEKKAEAGLEVEIWELKYRIQKKRQSSDL